MANRYWVGGAATWDATAGSKWSTTSGGAGGSAVPTSSDDVFFNAASGAVNVTIGTGNRAARSIDFTGFTGTIVGTGTLTPSGNLTLAASMGWTGATPITFVATTTGWTVTTNGKSIPATLNFNGVGGGWTFQDNLTTVGNVTLTSGTLNVNSKTVSCLGLTSTGSVTRVLTLGSAAITCTAATTGAVNTTATGLTVTANTATITCTGNGGGVLLNGANMGGASFVFSGTGNAGFNGSTGGAVVGNVTRVGGANKTDVLVFAGNTTITGTLTATGSDSLNRLTMWSGTLGTQVTVTAAAVALSNLDIADIAGAGAASWNLSAGIAGDLGGNSGITFSTPVTVYFRNNSSAWDNLTNWASSSGGSASSGRYPLPQDTARLDANSFSGATPVGGSRLPKIDCTGYTGTFNFTGVSTYYGSLILSAGMTVNGAGNQTFAGRGSHTITSAGKVIAFAPSIAAVTGTYTLLDAFNTSRAVAGALTVLSGTLNTNGMAVRLSGNNAGFAMSAGAVICGTTTWTFDATTATSVWNITGGTVSAADATFVLAGATSANRTFVGGGNDYGTLDNTLAASTGLLSISGSNSFDTLKLSGGARTLKFVSGAVTTVRDLQMFGSPGSLVAVAAVTPASATTLSAMLLDATGKRVTFQGDAKTGGLGYLAVDGTGDWAQTVSHSSLQQTTEIDVRVDCFLTDNTPAAESALIAKWTTFANQRSWTFAIDTGGQLRFGMSPDGGATASGVNSTSVPTGADGTRRRFRATRRSSDGRVQFFTRTDADIHLDTGWTQLGTDVTLYSGSPLFAGGAPLSVGATTTPGNYLAGGVYRAIVKNAIAGTTVFDADFTERAPYIGGEHLSLLDIKVNGHGRWYAGSRSVNLGNNSGWTWEKVPSNGQYVGVLKNGVLVQKPVYYLKGGVLTPLPR